MDIKDEIEIKAGVKTILCDKGSDGFVLVYLDGDKLKTCSDIPFGKLITAISNTKFGRELLPNILSGIMNKK